MRSTVTSSWSTLRGFASSAATPSASFSTLADEHARFDLVYVDGSHRGLDVLVDAALSWPLLEVGGVVVFDDYRWTLLGDDPLLRPGPAIDAFVGLVAAHSEVLFHDRQVALRKLP